MTKKPGRPIKYTKETLNEINRYIEAGLTVYEAGRKVGINTPGAVYKLAKRLGIPKRYFTNNTTVII